MTGHIYSHEWLITDFCHRESENHTSPGFKLGPYSGWKLGILPGPEVFENGEAQGVTYTSVNLTCPEDLTAPLRVRYTVVLHNWISTGRDVEAEADDIVFNANSTYSRAYFVPRNELTVAAGFVRAADGALLLRLQLEYLPTTSSPTAAGAGLASATAAAAAPGPATGCSVYPVTLRDGGGVVAAGGCSSDLGADLLSLWERPGPTSDLTLVATAPAAADGSAAGGAAAAGGGRHGWEGGDSAVVYIDITTDSDDDCTARGSGGACGAGAAGGGGGGAGPSSNRHRAAAVAVNSGAAGAGGGGAGRRARGCKRPPAGPAGNTQRTRQQQQKQQQQKQQDNNKNAMAPAAPQPTAPAAGGAAAAVAAVAGAQAEARSTSGAAANSKRTASAESNQERLRRTAAAAGQPAPTTKPTSKPNVTAAAAAGAGGNDGPGPGPSSMSSPCPRTGRFDVHRAILAARCPYFATLFEAGMRDSATRELALPDTEPDALKPLLQFLYGGALTLTSRQQARACLALADRLLLPKAAALLRSHLLSGVTVSTVVPDMLWAAGAGQAELLVGLLDFAAEAEADLPQSKLRRLAAAHPALIAQLCTARVRAAKRSRT